jgi:hypothetical protein
MARPVGKSFVKKWRERLQFADQVWESRGLAKSITRESSDDQLKRFLSMYRCEPWAAGWAGIPGSELSVSPLFFAAKNTFVAQLLSRTPDVEVLPRNRTSIERAPIVEAILNYDIDELKMKREWSLAVSDSFDAPWGMVRHGHTPAEEVEDEKGRRIEPYAMARPNKPWMRRHKIWDFRCDPLADSPQPDGDATWCAFRSVYTEEQLRKNRRMAFLEDLPPTREMPIYDQTRTKRLAATPVFACWSVYDKTDKTWFQIPETGDALFRQPDDWPIPWEDLPYDVCYFNPQMDTMFPLPFAAVIWQPILELSKVRTLMIELVKRMRRIIIVNEDALGEGESDKIDDADLTEILKVKGNLANAVGQTQLGGFASELLGLCAKYESDIREAIGQSGMDRAQRVNVQSATEAASIAQGSAIAGGRNVERVEDFIASSLRHYAIARQATTTEEEVVPIVGRKLAAMLRETGSYLTISPDQIEGEYDYKIVAGSSLPDNRQRRIQEAMAKLEIAKSAPELHDLQEAYARVWEAFGERPSDVMLNLDELKTTQAAGARQQPGQEPTEGGADLGAMLMALNRQETVQ